MRCLSSLLVVLLSLFVFTFGQPIPEAILGGSSVEWPTSAPDQATVLAVAGPGTLYFRQECPAGHWARFSLLDQQGQPRPDGVYRWELVLQGAGWETPRPGIRSGWFQLSGGKVVAGEAATENPPIAIEQGAPENSIYADAEGRIGLGTTIPRTQLHIKGAEAALTIEDTAAGGHEYSLGGERGADGSLRLIDQTAAKTRWMLDSEGRMGINTTEPTSTLTVDGYIESTKGFLVNGRPVGGFGLIGGNKPLYLEGGSNSFFGTSAGSGITTGSLNSFFGVDAGKTTTTGAGNTFAGWGAGSSNAAGNDNSFFGAGAGLHNTASNNAFFGQNAGLQNTDATENSFFGKSAGEQNAGSDNAAFGYSAGKSNSGGFKNSFFGSQAGYGSVNGYHNCFFGYTAGYSNDWGNWNAFFGFRSGYANRSGWNAFFGANTGENNTEGHGNSFLGYQSGMNNTTGNFNTFVGSDTGYASSVEEGNTLIGAKANFDPGSTPSTNPVTNSTAIGYHAYVTRADSLVLGGVKGFNSATAETFVGIGTTAPDRQLVVEGSQALGKFRRYSATSVSHSPAFLFERGRGTNTAPLDMIPGDYLGKVQFRGRVGGNMLEYGALAFVGADTNQNGRFAFVDRDLATERMVVLNTGNVGIGTSAPTERLDVAGNLRVRGAIVYGAPAVPVPDYVFESDYRLMPVSELKQYLDKEKHLPNMPKASEIQEKGINLGEFQMKLLEKVEELTLYTVEQAKRIEALEQKIRELEAKRE